jgi:hypothetical protein
MLRKIGGYGGNFANRADMKKSSNGAQCIVNEGKLRPNRLFPKLKDFG